jgi:hypothetical protein
LGGALSNMGLLLLLSHCWRSHPDDSWSSRSIVCTKLYTSNSYVNSDQVLNVIMIYAYIIEPRAVAYEVPFRV